MKIGATDKFPDGKLSQDDEGELRMAISNQDSLVRLDFGKAVAWMAFPKATAIELAKVLAQHAGATKIIIE